MTKKMSRALGAYDMAARECYLNRLADDVAKATKVSSEYKEPPLTCPHIDKAISSGNLPPEIIQELLAIRDINSQLRYGTWSLIASLKDLLTKVKEMREFGEKMQADLAKLKGE
jgi:hypothetical protein